MVNIDGALKTVDEQFFESNVNLRDVSFLHEKFIQNIVGEN